MPALYTQLPALAARDLPSTSLVKRYWSCDSWGYCTNNSWSWWGRWVLLAVVIFIILFWIIGVYAVSRKRVNVGRNPIYGTGWMMPPSYQQSQNQYGMSTYAQPPPMYQGRGEQDHSQGPYSQPPPQDNTQFPQYNGAYDSNRNDNSYQQGQFSNNQPPYEYTPPSNPPPAFVKH